MVSSGPNANGFRLQLGEQILMLHSSGAAYWENRSTLFVADLHLGKSTTFRRGGIPVPPGATQETASLLHRCIDLFRPDELIVLGDLVHARCSWDAELEEVLKGISDRFEPSKMKLIEGNHDRGSRQRWSSLSIEVQKPPFRYGPWILVHDEESERPESEQEEGVFILAGHLHPGIKLKGGGETIRLRCFRLWNHCLTLPAFGEFTGSKELGFIPGQKVYAIVEDSVRSMEGFY